jgi:signal transduction histidine kinase
MTNTLDAVPMKWCRMELDPGPRRTAFGRVLVTTCLAATLIALTTLVAWQVGEFDIASVSTEFVPMAPSTAVGIALTGVALLVWTRFQSKAWTSWVPTSLLAAALVLTLLNIMHAATGIGFCLDDLLGATEGTVQGYVLNQPSHVAVLAVLSMILAAMLLTQRRWDTGLMHVLISGLCMACIIVGGTVTMGYAYGTPLLYGGSLRPVSLLAGISACLIGIALIALHGPEQWPVKEFVGPSVRARLHRAFMPLVLTAVLVSGALSATSLTSGSNPALVTSLVAIGTAVLVGYMVATLSGNIGGQIDDANARLLKAQEDLRLANEKLNVLGSITTHDATNKLAVTTGWLELLRQTTKDPQVLEKANKADEAARSIGDILQSARKYQRIGTEQPAWVDVDRAFKESVAGLRRPDVTFTSEVTGLEVLADSMFPMVIANLLENSFRHGGKVRSVTLRHQVAEDGLTIVYEDDGVGITAREKADLFKKGVGKHTGLGMFLSKEILEFSGLSITETGIPGEGARFEIWVPAGKFRFRYDGQTED